MTAVTERTAVRRLRHAPEERPMIVIWEVTRACALVCLHCRADAQHRRNPHELTTEQGGHSSATSPPSGSPFPSSCSRAATRSSGPTWPIWCVTAPPSACTWRCLRRSRHD